MLSLFAAAADAVVRIMVKWNISLKNYPYIIAQKSSKSIGLSPFDRSLVDCPIFADFCFLISSFCPKM